MPRIIVVMFLLGALAITGCTPPEAPVSTHEADTLPFRARITFEPGQLPGDARLAVYVLEANLETGDRRVIGETIEPAPAESPVTIQVDVERESVHRDFAYEMHAAIVDGDGRKLMGSVGNKAPMPALGLHHETIHPITLLALATPPPPEEVFTFAGTLSFNCGDLAIEAAQADDHDVLLRMPGAEFRLAPAVATAGGRFSDGSNELWIVDEHQAFLILQGQSPVGCERG